MDIVTKERRSEIMRRIGPRHTRPEKAVRRVLRRLGYRYTLYQPELPGKPDLALPEQKTAIFVHGCFWHGCRRCDKGTRIPKTRRKFWLAKVAETEAVRHPACPWGRGKGV